MSMIRRRTGDARNPHGRAARIQPGRNDGRQVARARRHDDSRHGVADAHLRQFRTVDGETLTVDGNPAAFNGL